MKALTPEEVLKVLKAAGDSKRNHAMILLAFKHGLRASEVCNLTLSDVCLKNGEIVIRRLKGSLRTTQQMTDIPGQPFLSERRALRQWLAERESWGDRSEYLFISQKGGRLDRTAFFRIFQSAAAKAGLPRDRQHPHCLKHALGFALVEAGVKLAIVRQRLGHKSISSTAVYTQPTDAQANRVADAALAGLF